MSIYYDKPSIYFRTGKSLVEALKQVEAAAGQITAKMAKHIEGQPEKRLISFSEEPYDCLNGLRPLIVLRPPETYVDLIDSAGLDTELTFLRNPTTPDQQAAIGVLARGLAGKAEVVLLDSTDNVPHFSNLG